MYEVSVKNMETYSVEADSEEEAIIQAIDYFCDDDEYYGSEFAENVAEEDCEIVGWED
jgi:hypothetical protein